MIITKFEIDFILNAGKRPFAIIFALVENVRHILWTKKKVTKLVSDMSKKFEESNLSRIVAYKSAIFSGQTPVNDFLRKGGLQIASVTKFW